MDIKIRNAVPEDAKAIQNIIAFGQGGKKIKEFINEKRDNVSETEFEFDVNRFL